MEEKSSEEVRARRVEYYGYNHDNPCNCLQEALRAILKCLGLDSSCESGETITTTTTTITSNSSSRSGVITCLEEKLENKKKTCQLSSSSASSSSSSSGEEEADHNYPPSKTTTVDPVVPCSDPPSTTTPDPVVPYYDSPSTTADPVVPSDPPSAIDPISLPSGEMVRIGGRRGPISSGRGGQSS